MEIDNYQENKLQILGKLTASLIHEIRNPLSAIKLNLEYLEMIQNELPDDARESLKSLLDATSRIQYLTENLSTFTRKNFKEATLCSVNEVTLSAINIMNSHARSFNISINCDLGDNLPKVSFDRNKLLQVFLNLITNAIEACERGGNIYISTLKNTSKILWEIRDDGMGISEENKDKILNDFYTSKKKGTGLGLSVCQSILNEYDCGLSFQSEVGLGTKFIIEINNALIQGNYEV